MMQSSQIARVVAISAAASIFIAGVVGADAAFAAKSAACVMRSAGGTGPSQKTAKFQVYEVLLQDTGWDVWAAWMANGTTPGDKVKPVKYNCIKGTGLGVTCHGQTTICKL